MLVDDGQSLEIVFIEQLRHLVFLNAFMSENERLLRQRQHGGRGWREDKSGKWNGSDQGSVRIHQVDGADHLDPALELAQRIDGVLHGGGNGQGEELRGHTASSCFLTMLE